MNIENLVGKIVKLKPLTREYFDEYMSMFSETVKQFLHVQESNSEVKYLETRLEKNSLFYCVFLNEQNKFSQANSILAQDRQDRAGKLIGAIEIRDLTESDGQLYSWINENYWGSGAYQEALALISKKYFEICKSEPDRFSKNSDAKCFYYTANVDVENLRSYFALKKFGFIDSGIKDGPYGKQYKLLLICK